MAPARVRRRRGVAVAVSAGVHVLLLALLAVSAPALRLPTARFPPDITLEIAPLPPSLRTERPPAAAARAPKSAAKPTQASTPASAVSPRPERSVPQGLPPAVPNAPPAPAPAASGVAGPPAPDVAAAAGQGRDWRVKPEGGDVHGLVHEAIGCGHVQHLKLTSAEQAACDRKFASLRGIETPHVDLIPAEKRAYYDSVAAAYAKVREGGGSPGRLPVGPKPPALLADKGGGLYIPGVGCAIRFSVPRGWKSYHDRPPHSAKLGALPCFITPPQALGTEESAVQVPASLRERTEDAAHMKALDSPLKRPEPPSP